MKILLAVDSLLSSEAAVQWLRTHPWETYTTICVLSVVDISIINHMDDSAGSDYITKIHDDAAKSLVESIAKDLANNKCTVITAVRRGHVQAEIIDYAKEWEANFIIMGSHGHSRIGSFFLGSTSRSVLRGASCSVEIVRSLIPESKKIKILFATDGSEFSQIATDSIVKRNWPQGSEVRIISVFNSGIPLMDPFYTPTDVVDRINKEGRRYAEKCVETAKNLLSRTGMNIEVATLEGDPKSEILDEAKRWGADLIVVGSHGRRGLSRFLLGSVSETIALYAHCSVDVVRGSLHEPKNNM